MTVVILECIAFGFLLGVIYMSAFHAHGTEPE